MEIKIRKAVTADIEQICAIENEGNAAWNARSFVAEFNNSFSTFIVAEYKNDIAGFAVAWNVSDGIEINNISVKKEYRRRGIATMMIDYIKKSVKNGEKMDIFLDVAEKNIAARLFYKKLGFTETGIRKNYYRDDNAILMKLEKDA